MKLIKNRFMLLEDLGQGGYGSVYKAIDKTTNETVAIKFVSNCSFNAIRINV